MSIRPPAVIDRFYPGDKQSILRLLDGFFSRVGGLPASFDAPSAKGVVVPHAGYVYSGPTAARSYKALARGFKNIDTFVMLGPSHTGLGHRVSVSKMDFDTPLGIVKNNLDISDMLIERSTVIQLSEEAHILEHSVEVQLPFLQFIADAAGTDFTFVPITMKTQNIEHSRAVGKAIFDVAEDSGQKIAVIASSDFTHCGAGYGFIPCPRNQLVDWMHEHDEQALEKISTLDLEGFYKYKAEHKLTICGAGPIGALIEFSRLSGVKKGQVLRYATSYDVSRSPRQIVGYGSVVFD